MELLPTIEIARKSVVHCVNEFNSNFVAGCSVVEIEKLRSEYEAKYKQGVDVLKSFEMHSVLDVIVLVAETLCLDWLENLKLTNEETEMVAEELLKKWS